MSAITTHAGRRRIAADSSANLTEYSSVSFGLAPMKIITEEREFVDDPGLDPEDMLRYFDRFKGRSQTSCPNPEDWLRAFGDAEEIFCLAITSALSGSYSTACIAKEMYEDAHPGRRVFVIDSRSAGPELTLTVEKLAELIPTERSFEDICEEITAYQQQTGLLFSLESLKNFAANGRVSPTVARLAGVLGIRIVGKASDEGTLEPTDKCRGEAKSIATLVKNLKANGLKQGRVRITHCCNEGAALKLRALLEAELPDISVTVGINRGLCSYYAERGGLLVGYEKI